MLSGTVTDHTGSLRSAIGKPLLEQDDFGLKGTTQIVDTTWGNDVLKLYEAKLINQHSVGYRIIKDGMKQGEVGGPYNEITELKLYEGSAVLWGRQPRHAHGRAEISRRYAPHVQPD